LVSEGNGGLAYYTTVQKELKNVEKAPVTGANGKTDLFDKDLKVGIGAYLALIFAILFFSGIFQKMPGAISALDFTNLLGAFGKMGSVTKEAGTVASSFRGNGGTGARDGFLFALTLFPAVIFAIGVVEVVDFYGGLKAAQKLMTPLLRPLMGIPGLTGLTLIASLQSTDAGGSMTKALRDNGFITENEKTIFCAFQFSAGATITNYFSSGAALFGIMEGAPIIVPFIIMLICKVFGANVMRLYLKKFAKEAA
jgi:nucleoside recognition membrane protein YjiH